MTVPENFETFRIVLPQLVLMPGESITDFSELTDWGYDFSRATPPITAPWTIGSGNRRLTGSPIVNEGTGAIMRHRQGIDPVENLPWPPEVVEIVRTTPAVEGVATLLWTTSAGIGASLKIRSTNQTIPITGGNSRLVQMSLSGTQYPDPTTGTISNAARFGGTLADYEYGVLDTDIATVAQPIDTANDVVVTPVALGETLAYRLTKRTNVRVYYFIRVRP